MTTKTLYSILGVTPDANSAQIESAYADLLAQCAEGRNLPPGADNQTRLVAVKEAYSVLSDPLRRQNYNQKIFAPAAPVQARLTTPEIIAIEPPGGGMSRLLWGAALVLAAAGVALYFQHQREALRVQQELQAKQLEVLQKAQEETQAEFEARMARQQELDRQAQAAREARQRDAERQQDARNDAARLQRETIERQQAEREAENRRRAAAQAAQQQLARDKAQLRQLEIEHYGHVITTN